MSTVKQSNFSIERHRTLSLNPLRDFLSLTKPKILVLLLISTACPIVLASGGEFPLELFLWTLTGGALISGSASAINCVWEKNTDRLMERTKNRPIPAGRLSSMSGVVFALLIGLIGLLILAVLVNPLAAAIALFGHLFYVLIYTIWLKPITPQNIVIGGAAGAVPPMVGWAAVTGQIDLTSILMFMVIFLWTPPHFWALALNRNEDYRRAGIPMLPVVAGEKVTHLQMFSYALALIPVSILLVFTNEHLGGFSLITLGAIGCAFAYKVYQLKIIPSGQIEAKERKAWDVFGFSVLYLGLFFACLVIDAALV